MTSKDLTKGASENDQASGLEEDLVGLRWVANTHGCVGLGERNLLGLPIILFGAVLPLRLGAFLA